MLHKVRPTVRAVFPSLVWSANLRDTFSSSSEFEDFNDELSVAALTGYNAVKKQILSSTPGVVKKKYGGNVDAAVNNEYFAVRLFCPVFSPLSPSCARLPRPSLLLSHSSPLLLFISLTHRLL